MEDDDGIAEPLVEGLEGLIYERRDAYYDAMAGSTVGRPDGSHDPWPWLSNHAGTSFEMADVRRAVPGVSDQTSLCRGEPVVHACRFARLHSRAVRSGRRCSAGDRRSRPPDYRGRAVGQAGSCLLLLANTEGTGGMTQQFVAG